MRRPRSKARYGDRSERRARRSSAIADRAAQVVRAGDSLLIDAGSPPPPSPQRSARVGSFTVITNSILVAQELWNAPQASEVYLLGGRYSGENQEVLGPLVVEQIQRLQADHAVLTVGAVDPAGRCLDFNAEEAYIARAMIASARQTTMLADSSKLGRHALFQVCEASQIDRLVTDGRRRRRSPKRCAPPASKCSWPTASAVSALSR